jgi:hypothetical protein
VPIYLLSYFNFQVLRKASTVRELLCKAEVLRIEYQTFNYFNSIQVWGVQPYVIAYYEANGSALNFNSIQSKSQLTDQPLIFNFNSIQVWGVHPYVIASTIQEANGSALNFNSTSIQSKSGEFSPT